MKNIAVIPCRGGSTRIPQKNFLNFFGKPMFLYVYDAAVQSGLFEDVVISTNSQQLLDICKALEIDVPFRRPDRLAEDDVTLASVCAHALEEMEKEGKRYDNLCLLWATAVMMDAEDLQNSYEMLMKFEDAEAVVGVTECFHYYPAHKVDENGYIRFLALEDPTVAFYQDLPDTFIDNESMSWIRRQAFAEQQNWLPKKSRGYQMPRYKSVSVDWPEDLELLTYYYQKYKQQEQFGLGESLKNRKKVFFDTEFTRGGQNTTLISIGFVSDSEETLYIELNDYDPLQVTPWLEENILNLLDGNAVSSDEARQRIEVWFEEIAGNEEIMLVCAGKQVDFVLLFNLWGKVESGNPLRRWDNNLPPQINHKWHPDMDTLFLFHGIDPNLDRDTFAEIAVEGNRHHALYDALVLKQCWEKLIEKED